MATLGGSLWPIHQDKFRSRITSELGMLNVSQPTEDMTSLFKGTGKSQTYDDNQSPCDSPQRPNSALARGVQITEFRESRVNPEPVVLEETEILLEEYLSPRKLRDLTGLENLEEVHYLEMKVDTTDTSLGNFGAHLPNLTQLKLSNSVITTVRDLGSSLDSVKVLWIARCGVEDLDGLPSLSNLKELYLAYNEVYDLSPCGMLENLQLLDLEGNNVDDISQVEFLALCTSLTHLTLEGNPVCVTPSPDEALVNYNYRQAVKKSIPHLKYLDDELLLEEDAQPKKQASVFGEDWKLIEEFLEDGTVIGSDESLQCAGRPGTAVRPTTGYRPGSALKPYTAGRRPNSRMGTQSRSSISQGSAFQRPETARPSTARPGSTENLEEGDDGSDLTLGAVVCGNPSKALKSRQRNFHNPLATHSTKPLFAQLRHKPEHTYDTALADDDKLQELFSELKEFKKVHEKRRQEIEASKGPQVLKIEHDEDEAALSSDGDESGEDLENSELECLDYRAEGTASSHTRNLKHSQRLFIPKSGVNCSSAQTQHDESWEAREEDTRQHSPDQCSQKSDADIYPVTHSHHTDYSLNDRPLSGPELQAKGKFKLGPIVDKTQSKVIDSANPVIRMSIHSPEKRVPDGPRAITAKAAIGQPQPQLLRIRKGNLANVQLLPSKFTK